MTTSEKEMSENDIEKWLSDIHRNYWQFISGFVMALAAVGFGAAGAATNGTPFWWILSCIGVVAADVCLTQLVRIILKYVRLSVRYSQLK